MTKEEFLYLKAKHGGTFRLRTILLYLVSMIPFITLFSTVFYIVYLGHGYMTKLEELRATTTNNNKPNNSLLAIED